VDRNLTGARKRLFAKRGKKCEKCGYVGYLELNHIIQVSDGGTNDDDNLEILCEDCHAKKHGKKKKKYVDPAKSGIPTIRMN